MIVKNSQPLTRDRQEPVRVYWNSVPGWTVLVLTVLSRSRQVASRQVARADRGVVDPLGPGAGDELTVPAVVAALDDAVGVAIDVD